MRASLKATKLLHVTFMLAKILVSMFGVLETFFAQIFHGFPYTASVLTTDDDFTLIHFPASWSSQSL